MKLRKICAHGALASLVSEPLEFAAYDLIDARNALTSAYPEVKGFFWENPEFVVVVSGKDKADPKPLIAPFHLAPFADDVEEVHLVPRSEGAGIEIAAVTFMSYTGWAAVAAYVIVNIAVAVVMGAISQMLGPKASNGPTQQEQNPSFLYNGPVNVTEQGVQVPIVYGTFMTGSVVVSAGITVEQMATTTTPAPAPTQDTSPSQPANPPAVSWQFDGGGP